MHTPPNAPDAVTPWPSAARGWTVAGLLALASIVSQADRTVVTLMAGPIKAAFELSDTAFSVLQSVAFNVFYVLACIPIGRLADRFPRRTVLGLCMGLFSLFAMTSGLARSYLQLFLIRIGVGVGEASVTPASFSLLSDHFPPERLGRPISVFLMSAPFGQGLTLIAGGSLLQWLTTSSFLQSGLFSGMAPWQVAFIIVGFPGLLLVPALLLLREPPRRGPGGERPLSVREVIDVLLAAGLRYRRRVFGGLAQRPPRASRYAGCAADRRRLQLRWLRRDRHIGHADADGGTYGAVPGTHCLDEHHAHSLRRHVDPADRAQSRTGPGLCALHHHFVPRRHGAGPDVGRPAQRLRVP